MCIKEKANERLDRQRVNEMKCLLAQWEKIGTNK